MEFLLLILGGLIFAGAVKARANAADSVESKPAPSSPVSSGSTPSRRSPPAARQDSTSPAKPEPEPDKAIHQGTGPAPQSPQEALGRAMKKAIIPNDGPYSGMMRTNDAGKKVWNGLKSLVGL